MSFERMMDQVAHDLGWHEHNMRRDRPYNGQPHTDTGERGRTEVKGVTFRDLRDCFVRAYCLAMGSAHDSNMPYYNEATKGENATLCEDDIYKLKGDADMMAVFQNFACEVEKLMGIYPNVPKLVFKASDDIGESPK